MSEIHPDIEIALRIFFTNLVTIDNRDKYFSNLKLINNSIRSTRFDMGDQQTWIFYLKNMDFLESANKKSTFLIVKIHAVIITNVYKMYF